MEYEKTRNLLDNKIVEYKELINLLETSAKIYSDTWEFLIKLIKKYQRKDIRKKQKVIDNLIT